MEPETRVSISPEEFRQGLEDGRLFWQTNPQQAWALASANGQQVTPEALLKHLDLKMRQADGTVTDVPTEDIVRAMQAGNLPNREPGIGRSGSMHRTVRLNPDGTETEVDSQELEQLIREGKARKLSPEETEAILSGHRPQHESGMGHEGSFRRVVRHNPDGTETEIDPAAFDRMLKEKGSLAVEVNKSEMHAIEAARLPTRDAEGHAQFQGLTKDGKPEVISFQEFMHRLRDGEHDRLPEAAKAALEGREPPHSSPSASSQAAHFSHDRAPETVSREEFKHMAQEAFTRKVGPEQAQRMMGQLEQTMQQMDVGESIPVTQRQHVTRENADAVQTELSTEGFKKELQPEAPVAPEKSAAVDAPALSQDQKFAALLAANGMSCSDFNFGVQDHAVQEQFQHGVTVDKAPQQGQGAALG